MQLNSAAQRRRIDGFTLIELMVVLSICGTLAVIFHANYGRFKARTLQGEAKENLLRLAAAQKAYFAEKGAYAATMQQLGFKPEGELRYDYRLSDAVPAPPSGEAAPETTAWLAANPPQTALYPWTPVMGISGPSVTPQKLEIEGKAAQPASFVAVAVGNIDDDPVLDQWIISSEPLTVPSEKGSISAQKVNADEPLEPFTPVNALDDSVNK